MIFSIDSFDNFNISLTATRFDSNFLLNLVQNLDRLSEFYLLNIHIFFNQYEIRIK